MSKKLYIKELRLKDITVYRDLRLEFPESTKGKIIFLQGRTNSYEKINGTGKSSIIVSILTLLGLLSSFKSFIRKGQKKGEMYLKLENEDG